MAETKASKRPKWYDPSKQLLAFMDGPRQGQWFYSKRWDEEVRLAEKFGEGPVPAVLGYVPSGDEVEHPTDQRIIGQAMVWRPA